MDLALFTDNGIELLGRLAHYVAGVCWIGLLYYFNLVQGSYFKEADAGAKGDATKKLVPRALWWFRWAAMLTFLSGLFLLHYRARLGGSEMYFQSWGILILIGALLGTIMFLNVWLVIWPNQKIVIAAATTPDPNAPQAAARAMLASRTNTMFSIPMLFFMAAASHMPVNVSGSPGALFAAVFVVVGALEFNALKGKLGPLETVKGVITCGFVLCGVLYALVECLA